jgi:hypothetical protein
MQELCLHKIRPYKSDHAIGPELQNVTFLNKIFILAKTIFTVMIFRHLIVNYRQIYQFFPTLLANILSFQPGVKVII